MKNIYFILFFLFSCCSEIAKKKTNISIKSITIYRAFQGEVTYSNEIDSLSPIIKEDTYVPKYREEFDSLGKINRLLTNHSEGFADENLDVVLQDTLFIKTEGIKTHISKATIQNDTLFENEDIYKIDFADWNKKRLICKLLKGEKKFKDTNYFHEIYFR